MIVKYCKPILYKRYYHVGDYYVKYSSIGLHPSNISRCFLLCHGSWPRGSRLHRALSISTIISFFCALQRWWTNHRNDWSSWWLHHKYSNIYNSDQTNVKFTNQTKTQETQRDSTRKQWMVSTKTLEKGQFTANHSCEGRTAVTVPSNQLNDGHSMTVWPCQEPAEPAVLPGWGGSGRIGGWSSHVFLHTCACIVHIHICIVSLEL